MPLYEYRCDACGQPFEIIQKFSEVSETCRLCGKGPVHRQVSAPGFQFKGTGWYITDYAQKGKTGGDSAGGKSDGTDTKERGEGVPADKGDAKKPEAGSSDRGTKSSESAPSTPAPAAKS